jgi:hypothetical protein
VALVLSIAALAAAGCGSSSKSKTSANAPTSPASPSTPSTPSTTATTGASGSFVAQWNNVCTQFKAQAAGATTNSQAAALIQKFLPKFQAIQPPASAKADYAQLMKNLQTQLGLLQKGDRAGTKKIGTQNQALERKLGLPRCA